MTVRKDTPLAGKLSDGWALLVALFMTLAGCDQLVDLGRREPAPPVLVSEQIYAGRCDGCTLTDRNMNGARMSEAIFVKSDFSGSQMRRVTADLARFEDSRFLRRSDLSFAILRNAKFQGCDFINAIMTNVEADGASFIDVRLNNADLGQSRFTGASLEGVILTGAQAPEAIFVGANLTSVEAVTADFTGADFSGATLVEAILVRAQMRNTLLVGANLSRSRLALADLRGARLDEANLSGADMAAALGLTQRQLATACGDRNTRLPPGLFVRNCRA
jgi:uncharacterized protein YjbI with pentapeptide repeats